jgi:CHAT domain-containing protein
MGAPTLGAFSATLPPLTSSSVELRQIGALYGSSTTGIFSGQGASKERWLAEAPRHQVLHLATHGVLNATHPLYSYLVMSDGLLESREILNQTLHADLVVLSACETGRGKAGSGEGLIGATWAFLAAGSSAVVASQWKVDAASTTQFMTGFHRALRLSRSTPALSVQRAAIQLMHQPEYRHPFYWAPFTVFGKGN